MLYRLFKAATTSILIVVVMLLFLHRLGVVSSYNVLFASWTAILTILIKLFIDVRRDITKCKKEEKPTMKQFYSDPVEKDVVMILFYMVDEDTDTPKAWYILFKSPATNRLQVVTTKYQPFEFLQTPKHDYYIRDFKTNPKVTIVGDIEDMSGLDMFTIKDNQIHYYGGSYHHLAGECVDLAPLDSIDLIFAKHLATHTKINARFEFLKPLYIHKS